MTLVSFPDLGWPGFDWIRAQDLRNYLRIISTFAELMGMSLYVGHGVQILP